MTGIVIAQEADVSYTSVVDEINASSTQMISPIILTQKTSLTGGVFCSCVKGTRIHLPDLKRGDAGDFEPNTTPSEGVAVLFEYTDTYHIAYVDQISSDGFYVIHYNKKKCERTEEWHSWDDPFIRGFYDPKLDDAST